MGFKMKYPNACKILFANMFFSLSIAYSAVGPVLHFNPAIARQMRLMNVARQAEQQDLTPQQAEYLLKVVIGSADIKPNRFPAPGEKLGTQAKKREQELNI